MRDCRISFRSPSDNGTVSPRTICATSAPCRSSNSAAVGEPTVSRTKKDAVVFAEPVLVRLHHRGRRTFQLYPSNAGGERFKIRVPDPAAGQLHQLAPVPREGQLENQTDDAVVVILDLSFQAFAGLQDHRLNPLQNGRP